MKLNQWNQVTNYGEGGVETFIIKMMLVSVGIGKIINKKIDWEKVSKGLSTVLGT